METGEERIKVCLTNPPLPCLDNQKAFIKDKFLTEEEKKQKELEAIRQADIVKREIELEVSYLSAWTCAGTGSDSHTLTFLSTRLICQCTEIPRS